MKSSELHRLIKRNGWICIRSEGSHYIYQKDDRNYPVPFHGSKEVGKGLEMKIKKEMKLILY
ncbi:type II toxin-antitoxin system HicA family toxin [Solitalea canadensis]|uniref:Putative periplasmic or secreted lipoprotein n=1 Tax=Solitalea canadensis (strain ATCC 29591 / DSM 3403 / JCM 21819 / LMG 8368 / NBRC 15130 / NCIMB 12057 / USAM 9D) TaxID=929556 RepID=H8KR99_SOLCM|nr:type II toxin-antitoxin system HicA family toxin [Solitalea canadensis]AFD07366.1 putative periplasmic or secreted lipoprotein [Solitalea canadensis DSM 3403]